MTDSIADTNIGEEKPQVNPENTDVIQGEAPQAEPEGSTWRDVLFADAPADDGTYQSHALNWDGEESTAKIIRGSEGILGDLNKAVILILMGVVQKFTEYRDSSDTGENEEIEGQIQHETGEEGYNEV